jgi:tripartite-type tricarboxylate transporter receptor subunit TctC
MRRSLFFACVLAAALPALAQPWPSKPIRIIVPFPASGSTDIITRIVGQRLSERLGQPVVIENRVSANGNIGTEAAVRAEPDGYTLVHGNNANININPHLYKLGFDPLRELLPVATNASATQLLVVNPSLVPVSGVKELIEYARARPGKVDYASAGNGSQAHLAAELLKLGTGVPLTHVPYKGGMQAVTDLLGGRVGIMFAPAPSIMPLVKSGKLRALATTGPRRAPIAPELPTINETAMPGFDVDVWYALFAPRATPAAIVRQLNVETTAILAEPAVREAIGKQGAEPLALPPAEFAAFLRAENEKWERVVKQASIKID